MEKIQHIIAELLKKMSVSFDEITVVEDPGGKTIFCIKTKESHLLIGTKGEHFLALSHVVKKMASKFLPEESFLIDVNDYQAKNIEKLKQKALMLAERARSFKASVPMDPMSSYERMIIHSFFADSLDIQTESQGTGPARHVVITFSENKPSAYNV